MKNKVLVIVTTILAVFFLSACGSNDDVLRVGMDLRYPPFETTLTILFFHPNYSYHANV